MKEVTKEEVLETIKKKEEFNGAFEVKEKLSIKSVINRAKLISSLKLYSLCDCGSGKKYKFCCKNKV